MSLRLRRVVLHEIELPLREPFKISSGETTVRRIPLLEVEDFYGRTVWSECVAMERPNYSPETVDTCRLAIVEWLWPRLAGREFRGPEEIGETLARDVRGHQMARAALEMASWALEAERRGVSLAELLGGTRERIATGISIGIQQDVEALVERARQALADGYRKIKVKIGPAADLEFLEPLRQELGPEAPLMADANSAYTLADADRLQRLDPLGLLMIEQPLAWDDLVEHAHLQRRLETPICLDESISSPSRARDMIELGSGRIVNIKPARVGGLGPARAIHDRCREAGIPVWCGGMLESGIGRAYNVALASLPNFTLPGDLSPSARYWERDIVEPEWTMDEDGWVEVPKEPGLGVRVDRDRVEDLTVRRLELTAD